jgi:hypothetical protein
MILQSLRYMVGVRKQLGRTTSRRLGATILVPLLIYVAYSWQNPVEGDISDLWFYPTSMS